MRIREFRVGDEAALHAVFYSAVHQLASQHYTPEQINAWAPRDSDSRLWSQRMQGIRPFVVEHAEQIVAYADVQYTGYIDHFYVSGAYARQGVGTLLMNRIHQAADARGIKLLTSDVSRTAQPFFQRFGFILVEQRTPLIRGIVVPNALMKKALVSSI
jgi:putative acetyltransferase